MSQKSKQASPLRRLSNDLVGLREFRLHVQADLADVHLRAAAHVVQDTRGDRRANELLRLLRLLSEIILSNFKQEYSMHL